MKPEERKMPIKIGMGSCYIKAEPLGVVCILGTWNVPFFTTIGPLTQVIAAGNCSMIKPSEISPFSALVIEKLITKYLDPSCFKVIQGKVQVAIKLTSLPFDFIMLTGSTRTGKLVAQAAARNLVPCLLELGGKCPTIIDETADLTLAARKIVFFKMNNCGQVCITTDYILCPKSKVEGLIEILKKFIVENYKECKTPDWSGKMINEFHYKRVCHLLKDHGGQVVYGNGNAHTDYRLTPTIILNPDRKSELMNEEIFGPLLPILTYETLDEAIDFVN